MNAIEERLQKIKTDKAYRDGLVIGMSIGFILGALFVLGVDGMVG